MSNKKDLEYLQNQLGVRDSMILNRLIDNHLEKIDRLQQRIDKAIEILQDYDLVENKDKVISDTFKALRGKDNGK